MIHLRSTLLGLAIGGIGALVLSLSSGLSFWLCLVIAVAAVFLNGLLLLGGKPG